jgi:hypothetical protein
MSREPYSSRKLREAVGEVLAVALSDDAGEAFAMHVLYENLTPRQRLLFEIAADLSESPQSPGSRALEQYLHTQLEGTMLFKYASKNGYLRKGMRKPPDGP